MSMIPVDVSGVTEPKAVPGGRYDLSVSSAEEGLSKEKRKPMITVYLNIDGHTDAPNVRHSISLPAPEDEAKTKAFKMLLLKRFLTLFGIPYDSNGFNLEDFIGATATAELKLGEVDDNGNQYNELVMPKMASEPRAVQQVARPPKTA